MLLMNKYSKLSKQYWYRLTDLYLGPFRKQFANYTWKDFLIDSGFGLWNAFLVIPGAIAFSGLARLPPIAGIASSIFPAIVYFLTGSSKCLSAGKALMRRNLMKFL